MKLMIMALLLCFELLFQRYEIFRLTSVMSGQFFTCGTSSGIRLPIRSSTAKTAQLRVGWLDNRVTPYIGRKMVYDSFHTSLRLPNALRIMWTSTGSYMNEAFNCSKVFHLL